MGRLEDLAESVRALSDEDLKARIQEIRKSRNIKRPAAVTHAAAKKKTDNLKKLLSTISKDELAKLLKGNA